MVNDLLKRRNFNGFACEQVTALLGHPDRTNFMGGAQYRQDADVAYWLGPERGLVSIDSEWLVFQSFNPCSRPDQSLTLVADEVTSL
jgi:hypothetical protein